MALAAPLHEGQKGSSTANIAGHVLHQRETLVLSRGSEARDVAEVFGVSRDLLEQAPDGFHRRQLLRALAYHRSACN